ncbi:MAG: hypothetical protein H6565_10610 [Lewinellaceae bacterium]|nr:hypothetical protein [Lewinellaceae bacterium]MCB9355892.1 hypothetical protein [Lewinellaceae bacterium]
MKPNVYLFSGINLLLFLGIYFPCLPEKHATDAAAGDDFPAYCRYINRAARAIYKNDFCQAAACYDSAFTKKRYPFYEDIRNSVLVNAKCGCYENNDARLRLLMLDMNVDTAFLFSEMPLRVFDAKNMVLIGNLEQRRRQQNKKENDLQRSLRTMFTLDQEVRDYENVNMRDRQVSKMVYAKRDSLDKRQYHQFLALCGQYGFPTEEKTGAFYGEDLKWSEVVYVLLWHFVLSKSIEDKDALVALIRKEAAAGNLQPSRYASLLDMLHTRAPKPEYNFLNTTLCLVNNEAYRPFVFYSDSLMREINTNRIAAGLDSFHIVQKQVVCQYFGKKSLDPQDMIPMAPAFNSIESLPYGLVKLSADQANIDLDTYRINVDKILKECNCREKVY